MRMLWGDGLGRIFKVAQTRDACVDSAAADCNTCSIASHWRRPTHMDTARIRV